MVISTVRTKAPAVDASGRCRSQVWSGSPQLTDVVSQILDIGEEVFAGMQYTVSEQSRMSIGRRKLSILDIGREGTSTHIPRNMISTWCLSSARVRMVRARLADMVISESQYRYPCNTYLAPMSHSKAIHHDSLDAKHSVGISRLCWRQIRHQTAGIRSKYLEQINVEQ